MNNPNHTYTKRTKGQKYVLGLGCSYTNPNFLPREDMRSDLDNYDFPKWTEQFKNHLGKKDTGLEVWSMNGASNEVIFNKAMHYLATDADNIEVLVIGWTQWLRFNIFGNLYCGDEIDPYFKISEGKKRNIPIYEHVFECMKSGALSDGFRQMIEWNLQYVLTVQEMCERLGVKYLMFTTIDSHFNFRAYNRIMDMLGHKSLSDDQIVDMVLENPITYEIKRDHYLDFPKFGDVFGDTTTLLNNHNHRFEHDWHPNEHGHTYFALLLWEKYQKTYGRK